MRERGRRVGGDIGDPTGGQAERPRPNRLSDEAAPNILTGSGGPARRNAIPSWVRRAAAEGEATAASRIRRAQVAQRRSDESEAAAQSTPNWFTLVIIGFIVISILRACLQVG